MNRPDPSSIALRYRDVSLSYRELDARVDDLALRLERHPGVIAVRARNEPGPALVIAAALKAGRPIALFSPAWTEAERARYRSVLGRAVEVDGGGDVLWEAADAPAVHHPEAAVILFTSGSTGEPRAAQLSRAHLERHIRNVIETISLHEAREQVLFVPLAHAFGALAQLLPGLAAGLTTHLLPGVGEARALIERGLAQGVWSGVPAQWEALLRHCDPAPARYERISHVVSAGAPMGEHLRRRLAERFCAATVYNAYGQSEAGPRLLCISSRHARFFGDVTGLPVSGIELKLGPGDELCVRGNVVMLGYLGAPAATAERIRDGWLHTGDAARIDADGTVTVLGRLDDVRKVGGERISLVEIDEVLRRLAHVEDAAATVEEDGVYGTRLVAFLCGDAELAGNTAEELREAMAKHVAWHKVPRRFFLVDALPRNHHGKLQRGRLAELRPAARELP